MQSTRHLLRERRFLPLFVTQLLGAFNDNLFKTAMVLFVVYRVYSSEADEAWFSALASGLFILPFFLLSALAGQLADTRDKARIIRIVKACEIVIMLFGGTGLLIAWAGSEALVHDLAIPLLLAALTAMGVHSTFFGPIKYAILPQHLHEDEVLGGTGLVEAGTYIAILMGTILAGVIPVEVAAGLVVLTAGLGWLAGRQVPPAPPLAEAGARPDYHIVRSSVRLVRSTLKVRRLFLAIVAISFFWTIGAILFIQFPPLAKNVLTAAPEVASTFLAVFSVGIAIGSVAINRLLKGLVSARFAPAAVIVMGVFVVGFHFVCRAWRPAPGGGLYSLSEFVRQPEAVPLLGCLLGIAVAGGMFVVPLYAFLTTTVDKSETARTVAANNIVNSGAMVVGSLIAGALTGLGVALVDQLLLSAAMCLVAAWLGWLLHRAVVDHERSVTIG